jgi:hypothetical protein
VVVVAPATYLLKTGVVRKISKERLRFILIEEGHADDQGLEALAGPGVLHQGGQVAPALPGGGDGNPRRRARVFRRARTGHPYPEGRAGLVAEATAERHPGQLFQAPRGAQFFGVYDVGADQLFGRWFYRKGPIT